MTTLTFVLQTAAEANPGGGISFWIIIGLMFFVMWFFMIRPQRKQQKALEEFRKSLAKGDKVVTVGGIFGTVAEIKETEIILKVDENVKIRVSKNAVQKDYTEAGK